MAEAFTEKYGIEVEVYNANSETGLARVVQESSAGRALNDVLIAPSPDIQAAQDEGLLGTYSSEYRDAISDKGKGEQWTGLRRLAFVAGWNTDMIDGADVPDEYSGFADPAWNDRISLELGDIDWYVTLRDYYLDQGMSEEEVEQMFRQIAENSTVAKGHTVQGELLAAGQFPVALSLTPRPWSGWSKRAHRRPTAPTRARSSSRWSSATTRAVSWLRPTTRPAQRCTWTSS